MQKSQSVSSRLFVGILFAVLTACGEVTTNTNEPPEAEPEGEEAGEVTEVEVDLNNPTGNTAVVLGTDFVVGTVNLVPIDEPRTATPNVSTTNGDAVVRSYGGSVYVVNRFGADNIQIIDPASFNTTLQFSTGNGTNPQDIIVTESNKAFVSLYQPDDNSSTDLAVNDVIVVDPTTGAISATIDLTPLTADDGERLPRASDMLIVDDKIFVAVQDLTSFFAADQAGKIAVIDANTNALTGSITLAGRNPNAMAYSSQTGLIYITLADFGGGTASANGGIEVVDPETLETKGIFVDDAVLGGAPGDIEVSGSKGFVTVGFVDDQGNFATKVVSFGLDTTAAPTVTDVYVGTAFIQDIAIDANDHLLVGDQDPTISGVVFVNLSTGERIGDPITIGGSPTSITFVER